uniref:TSA: Wollemia nobilis Ref_Wollemi_Transcript_13765_1333 transcribed RNA sequence n=1 Tax=Wollemia nobilis TaxID=56998 RepID=A0A0C9QQT7_9CONI
MSSMENIKHKHVDVGGLKLHVAEIGSGPDVLLLHGFPEIWYSWRHQMIALANAGFHAIAPDFRGYGLSDQPSEIEKGNYSDLVEDMAGLLDALGIQNVFVVAKDFGAIVAYCLDLLYPDRVRGIVTLGIPHLKPGPQILPLELFPKDFYIRHWQEPGRGLADFGRFDVEAVVRNVYILFSRSELPVAEEGKGIMDLYDPSTPLPPWFTENDLKMYSSLYERSGFVFPLQVPYISMFRNWGKLGDLADRTIGAPSLLIMGTKDYVLKFPGMEYYINSEMLKSEVPNLEITFFPEGSHFVQEQYPEEVNKLLLGFLNKQMQCQ